MTDVRVVASSRRDGGWVRALVVTGVALCAASMLVLALWAYAAPHSFADFVAYAPYNEHLVHDAGAFQIGLGVALVAALAGADGLVVALAGFAVASGLHACSHWTDRHLGGHGSDVPTLAVVTLVPLGALGATLAHRRNP